MKRKSNQRITKIKIDKIEELLKQAEGMDVADACIIQPNGSDLTPYPDLERLRIWTHNYLLSGITKVFANVSSDNSDDTYTVLIDGLPLYTSLLKSTKEIETPSGKTLNPILNIVGSPLITDDFIYSTDSLTDYIQIDNSIVKAGSELVLKITTGNPVYDSSKQRFISLTDDPFAIQIEGGSPTIASWSGNPAGWTPIVENINASTTYYIKLKFINITTGQLEAQLSYSSDGTSYSTPVTSQGYPNGSFNRPLYLATAPNLDSSSQLPFNGTIDLKESYLLVDGVKQNFVIDGTATKIVKTTKPGLWLSNFLVPISESQAGSWLCHNLINNNEQYYNSINADTFGNYCYSFIQRGLFFVKSEAGTYPDDCKPKGNAIYGHADICNLQWSPGDRSCTAHRTLEGSNPTGAFGNVYSTYSTLITPSDPDMQHYTEGNVKCLNIPHVNMPLKEDFKSIDYTARLVGKDWSYEFTFTPNGNGSGNDYGNGDNPEAPNGSNGGCITGTITSTIIDENGDEIACTQEVNKCYRTNQSFFNSDAPTNDDDNINDDSLNMIIIPVQRSACCSAGLEAYTGYPDISNYHSYKVSGSIASMNGYTCSIEINTGTYNLYVERMRCGVGYSGPAIYSHSDSPYFTESGDCGYGYCGSVQARGHLRLIDASLEFPETGVNLYLNIYDLAAEAEANGLPWDRSTCSTRFNIEISTTKCDSSWCTSRLIAKNIDINELGDISQLTTLVFN